jgi:hypothetical protein
MCLLISAQWLWYLCCCFSYFLLVSQALVLSPMDTVHRAVDSLKDSRRPCVQIFSSFPASLSFLVFALSVSNNPGISQCLSTSSQESVAIRLSSFPYFLKKIQFLLVNSSFIEIWSYFLIFTHCKHTSQGFLIINFVGQSQNPVLEHQHPIIKLSGFTLNPSPRQNSTVFSIYRLVFMDVSYTKSHEECLLHVLVLSVVCLKNILNTIQRINI